MRFFSFFCKVLELNINTLKKKEKGKKKHTLSTSSIFFCVELLLERLKKEKKKIEIRESRCREVHFGGRMHCILLVQELSSACVLLPLHQNSISSSLFLCPVLDPWKQASLFFALCVLSPDNFLHHPVESMVVIRNRQRE